MGITPELIAAIVGIAGTATGVGTSIASAAKGTPKAPSIPTPSVSQTAKALIPQTSADAAARAGGGFSPDFLANLVSEQTGQPGSGLDVLGDIRRSLGAQAP